MKKKAVNQHTANLHTANLHTVRKSLSVPSVLHVLFSLPVRSVFRILRKPGRWIRSPLIVLLLVQLVIVSLVLAFSNNNSVLPEAEQGVLDLSDWDEQKVALLPLDGEWAFYWQQHLVAAGLQAASSTPASTSEPSSASVSTSEPSSTSAPAPDLYAVVPGEWNGYVVNGGKLPAEGFATYRLTVQGLEPGRELALKVLPPASAYRLYLNEQLLITNGQAGETAETFHAYGKPQTAQFESTAAFDLILHISNFNYGKGGMNASVLLGEPDAVAAYEQNRAYKDFFLTGCLLMAIFYSLSLYFMNREEKINLYFGLVALAFLCRIPLASSYYMYELHPAAPIELMQFINYATYHLGVLFYALLIREFFPDQFAKRARLLFVAGTVLIMLLLLILPLGIYSRFYQLSNFLGFAGLGYTFYVIVLAAMRKARYAWLVFLGNGLLVTLVVLDVINTQLNRYEMGYFSNLGIIVFAFIYSFILARRFSVSFIESRRLSRKLLELDKLKDEFLANTSHELKTPLQGIISLSESLIEGVEGPLNERQVQNLQMVVSSGKRLDRLIHDILDQARLQHGDLQLALRPVHVEPLAAFVMQMCEQLHPAKQLTWRLELPQALPAVWADENRLVQILFNLVGNAAKFTPEGSVTVSAAVQGNKVEIYVIDTGIGISEDKLDTLFQPFTQADASISRAYGGVGLGLSITRQLVELHGGTIRAENGAEGGTRFTVALPICTGAEEIESTPVEGKSVAGELEQGASSEPYKLVQAGEHILVVDDDQTNIQAALNVLKPEGYTLTAVSSGNAALAAVRDNPDISLVILDVMMPELSGYEVCRTLRTMKSRLELPVLMVTARQQPEDLLLGFQSGANDYLVKPYDRLEFRARVRTLVELNQTLKLALKAEQAFLQAQIKPHFIYNTLGAIMSLCYTDGRKAGKLIAKFSHYLRTVFEVDSEAVTVKLRKELELIQLYTDIEQERFGDKLEVRYAVDPTLLHVHLPPLTIQPLVENAICHGVMKKVEGGLVTLAITREQGQLCVVVQDNGVGMSDKTIRRVFSRGSAAGGIGIANVNKRLAGRGARPLQVESREGEGTLVRFCLPLPAQAIDN